MNPQDLSVLWASDSFQIVSCAASSPSPKKPTAPFSLCLTAEERAALDRQAGAQDRLDEI